MAARRRKASTPSAAAQDSATGPQVPSASREAPARGHGAKPAAVREQAILALLSEKSIRAAAERCGVDEKTIRNWLRDDAEFRAEFEAAKVAVFQAGMARVQSLTAMAIDTLEALMGATDTPAVRLGAARTIAEIAMHQTDKADLLARLDEIEARIKLQSPSGGR